MALLCFGYGSNMLLSKLKVNVKSATIICAGMLKGYKFHFNKYSNKDGSGKGNIIETNNENDIVWGVIFSISHDDKQFLDDDEGLGKGYNEITIKVIDTEGKAWNCKCYIADLSAINNDLIPMDWYRDMDCWSTKEWLA